MKTFIKEKLHIRATSLLIILVLMFELFAATVSAVTYYTVRVNYHYVNGSPAHDPYIATFSVGAALDYDVTNPNVNGFEPMMLSDEENDPTELPTGGVSAPTTHVETDSLDRDITYDVYYVAGLTHYAARYYLQNVYDDLYTLDRARTDANQNRLGKTGSAPTDLESEEIEGFTSLFHEPDAIAADGSTVFRVYYDRNYYSINFNLGEGGYGVDPIYAKYETVYRIDEPKRMGYTFLGWARTSADSTNGVYGTDWVYIQPDAVVNVTQEENAQGKKVQVTRYYRNASDFETKTECSLADITITEAQANASPVSLEGDQTVPCENTYYKALWTPGTTHFTVMYWLENADNNGYTALLAKDVTQVIINNQLTNVTAGMEITPDYQIKNAASYAVDDGVITSSQAGSAAKSEKIVDLFNFNLGYANPNDSRNEELDPDDPNYNPSSLSYKYKFEYDTSLNANANHTCNRIIDFNDISPGTSNELAGCGDFFIMNTPTDTSVDAKYRTDASLTVRGDGTSRFNVFFRRKTFTLMFYYARQGYTNGALDPNKFSLTNSTKQFNYKANDAKYLNSTSKNVLEAIAEGSWEPNRADSLPTVKDEYKQRVTEGYKDFVDNKGGYYRYYYYQLQAKYNEPLKDKWLIDALDSVHRKGADEKEICIPGSIATEYYNRYYQDRSSSPNFTVKGIYEKLDKGILFTDSARNTMKELGIDYTELHFLISWTNTSASNGWNSSIENVLHFRYENYTELLPREIEILEHQGEQALLAEGNYTSVRTFTTKVKDENGEWTVPKTKWYGLMPEHIYETIDSGDVYPYKSKPSDRSKNNGSVYTNQTATSMTGFELECYRKTNGFLTLDTNNTEIDWSQDTKDSRRAIIKFFYRRLEYTLKYRNGNHKDESHTRTVMYGAPINSQYSYTEGEHEVNEYRYYWPDPEYFDPNRRDFFTFEGWYNDPRYEEPFDLATQTMPADDDTLFAKWSPKHIDVIFYDDYDDFYIDRKGQHPEKRIVLGKDEDDNDITDISVDYGSYVPLMSIPVNDDSPDNPRPKLNPIAEGASFAGWYYIRNRVPVRFEPENVPVTALNDEATGDNAKLRLFAEWVTKDVAKYKVSYVKDSDPDVEIAAPTTGRAYVWKTKTFNAKSGDELYDEYKWSEEGEDDGTNWWPTTNSSSMVIKANNSDDEFAPNNITFKYIQKEKVYYKVQYLDAASRTPLYEEVVKDSTHASVKEDARIIPGYTPVEASQTLVLTASTASDPAQQRTEELENNVITFLYNENKNEYTYEVEYLTQDLGSADYSVYSSETLTIPKSNSDTTLLTVANLFNNEKPQHLVNSGFTRVENGTKYTITDNDGTNPTIYTVSDDGTVVINGTDKKTIKIYFNRNSYRYKYQYIDQTAEKNYLNYLEAHKDAPDPTAGAPWNGVLQTFNEQSFTGQVGQVITITPDTDITATDQTDEETYNYTRVTNSDGTLNDVTLTIQPNEDWNIAKIYYRKDIERELNYKMVCVNDNSETDYYDDTAHTPKFGRLSVSMQTVLSYDDIASVTFHDTNNEIVDNTNPSNPVYLHLHRYTFLGWYTSPVYDKDHPETNRITTNATLTKEDLPTGTNLPANKTKYYALVKQDMVTMDVMFYYTDDYTVSEFKAVDDDTLQPVIQAAVNNQNNESAADSAKVHLTGERVGKKVTFTAPNGYQNHTLIPWHRNDGYSLSMTDIDEKVYKYQFVEWWEISKEDNDELIRHHNWNSEQWDPDSLAQQIARNKDQYFIAVYARRSDISTLPYKINYEFNDRQGNKQTYVKKDTLRGDELKEGTQTCKITDDGYYRLKDEFVLANAPYESNHGETLCWANKAIESTSVKGNPDAEKVEERSDRIITTITAEQTTKKAYAHYKLYPNDVGYTTIETFIGKNRETDEKLAVIDARELTYNDQIFSYWKIQKKPDSDVIAKCYDPWFTFCMMDNYYITPVYEGKMNPEDTSDSVGTSVQLRHLDNTRNRWTDEEGNPGENASTDLLYTDFEISFNNKNTEIFNSEDYKTGVVFELCGTLPANKEFVDGKDYGAATNYDNLKTAILNNANTYSYKSGKNRSIMISEIPTTNLTNKNRVEFGKPFKNTYKITKDGEGNDVKTYLNGRYLLKATAYLRGKGGNSEFDGDDNIILSNSVYVCLSDVCVKDLAAHGENGVICEPISSNN